MNNLFYIYNSIQICPRNEGANEKSMTFHLPWWLLKSDTILIEWFFFFPAKTTCSPKDTLNKSTVKSDISTL